jgi:hypothetical protein
MKPAHDAASVYSKMQAIRVLNVQQNGHRTANVKYVKQLNARPFQVQNTQPMKCRSIPWYRLLSTTATVEHSETTLPSSGILARSQRVVTKIYPYSQHAAPHTALKAIAHLSAMQRPAVQLPQ